MFTFGVAILRPLAGMPTAPCAFTGRKEGKGSLAGGSPPPLPSCTTRCSLAVAENGIKNILLVPAPEAYMIWAFQTLE